MPAKLKLLIVSFILCSVFTSAQNIDNWIETNEKVPVEKIYLHLDAEHYFQNDTIWFKVYLIDSRSGKLIPGAENIYINLFDKNSNSVLQTILLTNNGEAFGNLALPELMNPGNYQLQAYTDYLLNFSSDVWFQKALSVSRRSTASRTTSSNRAAALVADVSFFPEGGLLLEGITNLVAFKAVNKEGKGVDVSGTVKDEKGKTVASFKTDYKGMGLFFITPEPGKSYAATINGFPSFQYNCQPVQESLKIQLVNHTSNEVIVNIASNTEAFVDKTFYLVNMYRGEVLFYQPFKMEGINQVLKYDSQILKAGINRLVLLSDDLKPVSECLLFSKNFEINQIDIQADKENYNLLSEVQLSIKNSATLQPDEVSNLSISVLNKSGFGENGKTQNILSYLLIDSELNHFYEPSAEFFMNNGISSEAKLKLLMLTNGWSSYNWNSIPEKTKKLAFQQKAGIDLKGVAISSLTEKPLSESEITLVIQKSTEMAFLTNTTDDLGQFVFPGLLFSDTAQIHVQAKNARGNQNAEITISSLFPAAPTSEKNLGILNQDQPISSEIQKIKYNDYLKNRQYRPKKRKAETRIDDRYFRLYESADFVLEVPENEQSFANVIDYLAGKVPGVDVQDNSVRIRGTSTFNSTSAPLFLIDGVPLVSNINFELPSDISQTNSPGSVEKSDDRLIETVKSIPLNDVDKIEILKSPQNLATFGANGANGVIAIYTKNVENRTSNKTAKGIIEKQIVGYAANRDFYSPQYFPENKEASEKDFRTTLYWNPKLSVKNRATEISFYTSNETGPQIVIVEGITSEGKICLGEAVIEVNSRK